MAALAAIALVLVPAVSLAETGLQVGACVVADKRTPGRITKVIPYGYEVQAFAGGRIMTWAATSVVTGPCADAPAVQAAAPAAVQPAAAATGGGVCFPNDAPAGATLDGKVRAVLVRGFSHEPKPGEDGRITVHIKALRVGASHKASPVDQVQYQTPAGSTMYAVRAAFETCTDYNRRVVYTNRDRNFACFTRANGVFDCSMTANSPDLAHDGTREVPK